MLHVIEPGLHAEHFARPQLHHPPPLDGQLHPPLEHHAEALVAVALAHQSDLAVDLTPSTDAHHFPQIDVLELGEEGQAPQLGKARRVGRHVVLVEDLVAHRGQILRELGAVAVARVQILLERLADHRIHLLRACRG